MELYRTETTLQLDADPLQWWYEMSRVYPIMNRLVCKFFLFVATSFHQNTCSVLLAMYFCILLLDKEHNAAPEKGLAHNIVMSLLIDQRVTMFM